MPSVTITNPTSGSTVPHIFTAGGAFDISDLSQGDDVQNTVRSVVTNNRGGVLDTRVYAIPPNTPSGPWSVEHQIPDSRTFTGCVITATLLADAIELGSANVTNITVSG